MLKFLLSSCYPQVFEKETKRFIRQAWPLYSIVTAQIQRKDLKGALETAASIRYEGVPSPDGVPFRIYHAELYRLLAFGEIAKQLARMGRLEASQATVMNNTRLFMRFIHTPQVDIRSVCRVYLAYAEVVFEQFQEATRMERSMEESDSRLSTKFRGLARKALTVLQSYAEKIVENSLRKVAFFCCSVALQVRMGDIQEAKDAIRKFEDEEGQILAYLTLAKEQYQLGNREEVRIAITETLHIIQQFASCRLKDRAFLRVVECQVRDLDDLEHARSLAAVIEDKDIQARAFLVIAAGYAKKEKSILQAKVMIARSEEAAKRIEQESTRTRALLAVVEAKVKISYLRTFPLHTLFQIEGDLRALNLPVEELYYQLSANSTQSIDEIREIAVRAKHGPGKIHAFCVLVRKLEEAGYEQEVETIYESLPALIRLVEKAELRVRAWLIFAELCKERGDDISVFSALDSAEKTAERIQGGYLKGAGLGEIAGSLEKLVYAEDAATALGTVDLRGYGSVNQLLGDVAVAYANLYEEERVKQLIAGISNPSARVQAQLAVVQAMVNYKPGKRKFQSVNDTI